MYKEKSLDITKPRYSEHILPVLGPSPVLTRLHGPLISTGWCVLMMTRFTAAGECRGSFMHAEVAVGDSPDQGQPLTLQVCFGNGDDY